MLEEQYEEGDVSHIKYCRKCKKYKPVSEFHKSKRTKDGLSRYCSECKYEKHKKIVNRTIKINNTKIKLKSIYNACTTYKITKEQFIELYKTYSVCPICGKNFCNNDNSLKDIVIDHDHKSGVIRGLLCNNCNTLLGMAKDNILTLYSAILYLNVNRN